ncbi:MAG: hypothetical protein IIZ06_02935, partial [Kiritimatiellae bacterium]|nr:hypothetical protein [Kiritimatiellia bacterium]
MLRQFQVGRRKYLRSDELAEECDCRDDYRIVIGKTINVGILRTENDLEGMFRAKATLKESKRTRKGLVTLLNLHEKPW